MSDTTTNLDHLQAAGKKELAEALSNLEINWESRQVRTFLDGAHGRFWGRSQDSSQGRSPDDRVIGITGPPGVGKSTLIGKLIRLYRQQGLSVGVVAVDPSSQISGGSLLGDRTRMNPDPDDPGIFIRSLAARDRLGGLSEFAFPTITLMCALFDLVIVESVGVGQSESDVAGVVDTLVLCVQPGSGDSLQFMKAGLTEIPDIAVVTKADIEGNAEQSFYDLKNALVASGTNGWETRVHLISTQLETGLDDLLGSLDEHAAWLNEAGRRVVQRQSQSRQWLENSLREQFGRVGLKHAQAFLTAENLSTPFVTERNISTRFHKIYLDVSDA
ncbi:MAG: ArgK/MeaB family GTPase [Methyloligellaceae bacterium]